MTAIYSVRLLIEEQKRQLNVLALKRLDLKQLEANQPINRACELFY